MNYPFRVYKTQVEDHAFWIAESPCLKGCVGQGESIEKAISELAENETVWLETAQEIGLEIPDIPVDVIPEYSGKFTIRMAPSVHRVAAEYAKKENISLNQYVNDAIVAQNARFETLSYVTPEVKQAISLVKRLAENAQTNNNGISPQIQTIFTLPQAFFSSGNMTSSKNEPYLLPCYSLS